jgi:hypothetical protein
MGQALQLASVVDHGDRDIDQGDDLFQISGSCNKEKAAHPAAAAVASR